MDQVKIGKFISDERKAKGYTQKQLSELLGISDKTISKWECGGFQRGQRPHLAHNFAKQSVVCYTLCRRCRENAVAAGEGKGI